MNRVVRVAGESMAPAYHPSDLLLTSPVARSGPPRRGDVVLLHHGGTRMIKRVLGVGGDLVELEAGRLFVNGTSVDGRERIPGARTRTWQVPVGSHFVAGDNPAASDDSRVWDEPFVTAHDVEAVVVRRLTGRWPVRRVRRRRPAAATLPVR
jgi:signal peptidase I